VAGRRGSGVRPWQKRTWSCEWVPINRSDPDTTKPAYAPISVTSIVIYTIAYLPMTRYPSVPIALSPYLHTSAIDILPFYCHCHQYYEYLKASCLFVPAILSCIKSKYASKWSVKSRRGLLAEQNAGETGRKWMFSGREVRNSRSLARLA
jgi:hypothetical protein